MSLAKELNAARRDVGQLEKRLDGFKPGSDQYKLITSQLKESKKILSNLENNKEAKRKEVGDAQSKAKK